MLALARYRAELHSCGHLLSDSTDPDAEFSYVVDAPTRCHACTALSARQGEYRESPNADALLWSARRV